MSGLCVRTHCPTVFLCVSALYESERDLAQVIVVIFWEGKDSIFCLHWVYFHLPSLWPVPDGIKWFLKLTASLSNTIVRGYWSMTPFGKIFITSLVKKLNSVGVRTVPYSILCLFFVCNYLPTLLYICWWCSSLTMLKFPLLSCIWRPLAVVAVQYFVKHFLKISPHCYCMLPLLEAVLYFLCNGQSLVSPKTSLLGDNDSISCYVRWLFMIFSMGFPKLLWRLIWL